MVSFSNKLGAECARALAEALRSNTGLTVVHLRSNGLGTAGAAAMAEVLRGNAGLTGLYLNGNGIGATVWVWYSLPMLGPCARRQRYATACCAYRPTFIRVNKPPPPPPPPVTGPRSGTPREEGERSLS